MSDTGLLLYALNARSEFWVGRAESDEEAERMVRRHMKAYPSVRACIGKAADGGPRRVTYKRVE